MDLYIQTHIFRRLYYYLRTLHRAQKKDAEDMFTSYFMHGIVLCARHLFLGLLFFIDDGY